MSDNTGMNIKIMDKDYRVACPKEQQASLRESAEFLNDRLEGIKRKGTIIGSERIAIMAALNLAHELLSSQHYEDKMGDADLRMLNLQKKIDIALSEIDAA